MKNIYLNKKYLYTDNNDNKDIVVSSVIGLICENSSINSFCSNTNKTLIVNNSYFNSDENSYISSLTILNNSLVNFQNEKLEKINKITDKNSFYNFPRIYNDINYKIGGCIYSHIQNENYTWSSKLALSTDKGIYWMEKNQYSRYLLDQNIIDNIIIKNNKLSDEFNETNILYNNELIGGNFKDVKFKIANKIENNNNLTEFSLTNNKNYYTIENNNPYKTLKFNNIVNIENIEKFKTLHISFTGLNTINSNIYLYNVSNIETLSSFNCNIYVQNIPNNFDNIFSTNIINEDSINSLIFEKRQYNKEYNSNVSILTGNTYSLLNTYPQKGNLVITRETLEIANRNNNYRYGLQSHTHKSYSNINSIGSNGLLFPTQKNVFHDNITNTNYKQLYKNNITPAYQPLSSSYRDTHIQQLVNLPVGSIIQYYQINKNNEWLPKVPYGFYQLLEKEKMVYIDTDDCNSITYNALLLKVLGATKNQIKLPKGKNIIYNNKKSRIIQIIKYSELIKEKK